MHVLQLFAAGVSLAGFTVISDGSRFSVGCIDDMPREVRKVSSANRTFRLEFC